MKSAKAYFVVETAKTGHIRLSREYQVVSLLEEVLPEVDCTTGNVTD